MADPKPPAPPSEAPAPASAAQTSSAAKPAAAPPKSSSAPAAEAYKAPKPNPVWQMLGMRGPPKRLPSRNWMIFLSATAAFSAAVVYDKREKKRATARWARAVAPLASEPIANPSQLPRKLTVLLEAPPGDGLRVAQDHFLEYVKPILAASGLDWEFVQGREQGDVRAAVAEKIRRRRSRDERPEVELLPTEENVRDAMRRKNAVPEYDGPGGDIVIGRHAWKEYVRGLHEGWLGPLDPPLKPGETAMTEEDTTALDGEAKKAAEDDKEKEEEEKKDKSARPPQPAPHNSPDDYPTAHLPPLIPSEFSPSEPVPFPHLLGFGGTFTRLHRFLTRRRLADDIGRRVAAVCFAHAREWREDAADPDAPYEQQHALEHEERDWVKSAWKKPEDAKTDEERAELSAERVWTSPLVVDPRVAARMRRFEIRPEDEARARAIEVPETEVEGWIKGSLRALCVWGWEYLMCDRPKGPNVGDVDED